MEDPGESVTEAAEYQHDDGSAEIVFALENGRVLTVREYPDEAAFRDAVETATYVGHHDGVADLPGIEAFRDTE